MSAKKIIIEIQKLGFDADLIEQNKYIVGERDKDLTFPVQGFSNAFWVTINKDDYKIEYYKGQIFIEEYFSDIDSTLSFINEKLLPGIDRMAESE